MGTGVLHAAATTAGEENARWVVVAPHEIRLAPALPAHVLAAASQRPDVAIFYGDDVAFGEQGLARQLALKAGVRPDPSGLVRLHRSPDRGARRRLQGSRRP